ncbi:MAG: hypothetical protein KKE23_02780 [Nanoarchaeota archaeon]|nr:hypothetical protein [Nanoarchaeota archaeon]
MQTAIGKSKKRQLADKVATWGLLITAVIGILIPILDKVASIVPILSILKFPFDSSGLPLLIFIVSFLALSVGLERYATFDEIKKESKQNHEKVIELLNNLQNISKIKNNQCQLIISDFKKAITLAVESKLLMGQEAVFDEAKQLIIECDGSEIIRGTSLWPLSEDNNLPESVLPYNDYLVTLAKKIGEEKKKKLGMLYKVVFAFKKEKNLKPPFIKQRSINLRKQLFAENGAQDRIEIKWIDSSWSIEFLIVGEKHVIIGFPTYSKDNEVRMGIRFSNIEFTKNFVRWYEECFWQKSKPLSNL